MYALYLPLFITLGLILPFENLNCIEMCVITLLCLCHDIL